LNKMKTDTLILSGISRSFGGLKAVDDVSVEFPPGRITGLIGPNGAGKTTLFNIISGFIRPDKGEIWWQGEKLSKYPPWTIAMKGIGRLFQDVRIFKKITAIENVLLGKSNPGECPVNLLFNSKNVIAQYREDIERAREWLAFVGLKEKENVLAENLSYGQQKLLAIARLLMADSKVLLLDEPTAGINPSLIKDLILMIKKFAESGRTVIFIEHNMNIVLEIAHWVYFLNEGRIVAFGRPEDVLGNHEVRLTYLGL